MPSKYKTSFLKLNRYVGTDKPRMDDFNTDNLLLDNKFKEQSEKITNLLTHSTNTQNHITNEERKKWNNLLWEVGTYNGNGGYTQNINIGFKPRLGFIFQKDEFLISASGMGGGIPQTEQRSAILTPLGCSLYCKILDDGFMVCNSDDASENFRVPKLNSNGNTYIYIMFR